MTAIQNILTKHWHKFAIAALIYILLTILMTWPAVPQISQQIMGSDEDVWIFYWNNWWLEKAITEGLDPFFTSYMFYPYGTSLVAHSSSFLNSLFALAIQPWVGSVAAYNFVVLFGLWVGALGMFWLVLELTGRTEAALLAGAIFAFTPYHMTQALAHAHLGAIHWWPFYALFLHRLLKDNRFIDAALAGFFVALTLWSGLQLVVMLALWTLLYLAWHIASVYARSPHPQEQSPITNLFPLAARLAVVGIVAIVLSLPLLIPIVQFRDMLGSASSTFDQSDLLQTDLLAYFVPPSYNPLLGTSTAPLYDRLGVNHDYIPYLGFGVLILAGIAVARCWPESRFWAISTLVWIVLAAGPSLRLNGVHYARLKLPYALIGGLFPISTLRSPDRLNLLVAFSLPVLAGIGAAELLHQSKDWRRWLLIPLSLLVFLEFLPLPLPMTDLLPMSSFYEEMARDEADYAVADYPMGYRYGKLWLYYQTLHGKPLVEGHVSRFTLDTYRLMAEQPLLRGIYYSSNMAVQFDREWFSGELLPSSALGPMYSSLNRAGVRYILVHKALATPEQLQFFQERYHSIPVYEDAALAVYDTADPLALHYDGFPTAMTPSITLDAWQSQYLAEDDRWHFRIAARTDDTPVEPVSCHLQLNSVEEAIPYLDTPVEFFTLLPQDWAWSPGDLDMQTITTTLPSDLPVGSYHWQLSCPGGTYIEPDTVTMQPGGSLTYMRWGSEWEFGQCIHLEGYRRTVVDRELHITLWWSAQQVPGGDYKVFVHLLDSDGQLVSQYDGLPCQGMCPTGDWQPGQLVMDKAVLPLDGLSPGAYQLTVGLYADGTQQRVEVHSAASDMCPDDAAPLSPEFFIQ